MKASIDFETYSEAGYRWDSERNKWVSAGPSATTKGLALVGAPAYSEHPSTEVLCLAYDLHQGSGVQMWTPFDAEPPIALFEHIKAGATIWARNSIFEFLIWKNVCHARMGWPELPFWQLRDDMALSLAWGMPGSLEKCGKAMGDNKKLEDGKRLTRKFSCPHTPTKKSPSRRIRLEDDMLDALNLFEYCRQDVVAEDSIADRTPPLTPFEDQVFLLDQYINTTGCRIDMESVNNCIAIMDQAFAKYEAECIALTEGIIIEHVAIRSKLPPEPPSNRALRELGVVLAEFKDLEDDGDGGPLYASDVRAFYDLLTKRDVLVKHIRIMYGIKDPISRCQSVDLRHAPTTVYEEVATRTNGIKPTELAKLKKWIVSRGVDVPGLTKDDIPIILERSDLPADVRRVLEIRKMIGAASVKKLYSLSHRVSADGRLRCMFQYCGASNTGRFAGRGPQPQNLPNSGPTEPWGVEQVERVYEIAKSRSLEAMEAEFGGNAVSAIAGSLRGMFCATEGYDLICSDYSAIEAVVLAFMAGEQWRMDVFRTHGKIYEMGASKISGVPFEEFMDHKKRTGEHHPLRKKIGKVSELASGYQGGLGAWKAFGADKFMDDYEIQANIKKWRAESPNIVKYWYKQQRDAINATKFPNSQQGAYLCMDDVLYCCLPSGRRLAYHTPRVVKGKYGDALTIMGANSVTGQWERQDTYGGKLTENIIQAVARDILANAMLNVANAGYRIVMHVHDEIIAESLTGHGSIEEFERIMAIMPDWCSDWPIRAAGGWRGMRYRK